VKRIPILVETLVCALLLALAGSSVARAHGNHPDEAMGTIKAIDAEKLVLTTSQGKEMTLVLTAETKFERGSTAVGREDIEVGERAVVLYDDTTATIRAVEVKLGKKKS